MRCFSVSLGQENWFGRFGNRVGDKRREAITQGPRGLVALSSSSSQCPLSQMSGLRETKVRGNLYGQICGARSPGCSGSQATGPKGSQGTRGGTRSHHAAAGPPTKQTHRRVSEISHGACGCGIP